MRYLHTMIRVTDLEQSLDFWCNKMGLVEVDRKEVPAGKFTLVFLAASKDQSDAEKNGAPTLELTYNWESSETYATGRSWGHVAYTVDNIYEYCQNLMDQGVVINRPPREGRMAFVKSPDNVSIELLQEGEALPIQEPWASMENIGSW